MTLYEYDTLSTGKLLSNMQRSGPNCSMQYCIRGDSARASSAEPMGFSRSAQSKPNRRCPTPPSLMITLGQAATAAMPRRQAGSTASSRLAYGPTRTKPPIWFKMIVRSGTALANRASSGSCGWYREFSRHSPLRASSLVAGQERGPGLTPAGRTDATEWCGADGLHRVEHWRNPRAQFQIGVADNGRGHPGTTVLTASAIRRQPLDELDFTDRTHLLRAVGAVPRFDLDEHRRRDVVPTVQMRVKV